MNRRGKAHRGARGQRSTEQPDQLDPRYVLLRGEGPPESHCPEVARSVGVEKPKTERDAVLERIGGMTKADREALLSALRDQTDGKGKKTG